MKKVIFVFIILALIAFSGYRYIEREANQGTAGSSNIIQQFEVKEGEGSTEVGINLEKAGLIKDKYIFYYYVWKTGTDSKIQIGIYELSPDMTMGEMVSKFTKGEIVPQIIKLTIPEGFTNKKIIERLRDKKPELADDFEELVSCRCLGEETCACDKFSRGYVFLQEIPKGTDMEGFLFPDTYHIEKEDTAETLASKMLNNFKKKMGQDIIEEINRQEKSIHEIITMASIIEKEAKTDQDRRIVSGIFWKRIEDEHPLQSCATLAYITGEDKKQYSLADTQIDSPYNTYLVKGLPLGPVANPGMASILAALHPENTDYYYFLTDPATGEMVYSKTAEEHAENKQKHGL